MATPDAEPGFDDWAILELFGHRRLGGRVREVTLFGSKMCRIDIPSADGSSVVTQHYGGAAIFSCTATTEELARAVARITQPEPIHRWELPPAPATREPAYHDDDINLSDEEG